MRVSRQEGRVDGHQRNPLRYEFTPSKVKPSLRVCNNATSSLPGNVDMFAVIMGYVACKTYSIVGKMVILLTSALGPSRHRGA